MGGKFGDNKHWLSDILSQASSMSVVVTQAYWNDTGQGDISATRVKSHGYLVLLVSGVLSRALHLGLPNPASQPFLKAIDSVCAAWNALLLSEHTIEVMMMFQ